VSTFLDPNFAGAFLDVGLIVGFSRLAAGARVAGWKLLVLGVALVLTASRGAILAFVVGGCAILLFSGISKRLLRAIGVSALLVLLALPKLILWAKAYNKLSISDSSAVQRLISWAHGWTVLKDHWVLGVGFNTWGYVAERYGWIRSFAATYALDGGLIFVLVMTGVVGCVLYILMLGAVMLNARHVWRDRRYSAGSRGIAIAAAASIPMIVVDSLFANSLLHPFLMEILWMLWAFAFLLRANGPAADV
jgi:O-antigen ligase